MVEVPLAVVSPCIAAPGGIPISCDGDLRRDPGRLGSLQLVK
jgi:hypothetical protein